MMKMRVCVALAMVMSSFIFASEGGEKGEKKTKRQFDERSANSPIVPRKQQAKATNKGIKKELVEMGTPTSSIATTSSVPKIDVNSINHAATPTPMTTPTAPIDNNIMRVMVESAGDLPRDNACARISIKNMCTHAIKVMLAANGTQHIMTSRKPKHWSDVDVAWRDKTDWKTIKPSQSVELMLPTFEAVSGAKSIRSVAYEYDGATLYARAFDKNMRSKIKNTKTSITCFPGSSRLNNLSYVISPGRAADPSGAIFFRIAGPKVITNS